MTRNGIVNLRRSRAYASANGLAGLFHSSIAPPSLAWAPHGHRRAAPHCASLPARRGKKVMPMPLQEQWASFSQANPAPWPNTSCQKMGYMGPSQCTCAVRNSNHSIAVKRDPPKVMVVYILSSTACCRPCAGEYARARRSCRGWPRRGGRGEERERFQRPPAITNAVG
jgi:hypothetical protein